MYAHTGHSENRALDTRILSEFIYELNIARRQLGLYPAGHPQIRAACDAALDRLRRLGEYRESISLGIAPHGLLFDGRWLDEGNPVYRDFAEYLASFEIAVITFRPGLDAEELIRLHQLLDMLRKTPPACDTLPDHLREHRIDHIELETIAYSHFHGAQNASRGRSSPEEQLWDDFLQGLLDQHLDDCGRALQDQDRLDPRLVANLLNQAADRHPAKTVDYDRAISFFIAGLHAHNVKAPERHVHQLEELVSHLNPQLKQTFLNSTLRALDRHPPSDDGQTGGLSEDIITSALAQLNSEQKSVSSRTLNLLGELSKDRSGPASDNSPPEQQTLPREVIEARTEILLLEDRHDEYVPGEYQQMLREILQGRVNGNLPAATSQQLLDDLAAFSVDRQCCGILFNMLNNCVEPDTEDQLQEHLAELSRFFLDTGDFQSLLEIYRNWSDHLFSDHAHARFLDERVLGTQTSDSFMNEVLDSLTLWAEDKLDEISAYIHEIGEPYAELLIERLGTSTEETARSLWVHLLAALEEKARPLILQGLNDRRWSVVQSLLQVFDSREQALPVKEVHHLATTHPHPQVRKQALRLLFRCNPATAQRLLLKELSSGDSKVLPVFIPLATLSRDDQVQLQLHRILEAEQPDTPELKKILLETLAEIGSPRTIPLLARLLKKKRLLRSRRRRDFERDLIATLGQYPADAVLPLLNALVNTGDREQSRLAREQTMTTRGSS